MLCIRARGCCPVQHPRHSGCFASVPVAAALCSTPRHSGCFASVPVAAALCSTPRHSGCFVSVPVAAALCSTPGHSERFASVPVAAGLCSTPGTQDAMHPCPWLLPCAAPPALRTLRVLRSGLAETLRVLATRCDAPFRPVCKHPGSKSASHRVLHSYRY